MKFISFQLLAAVLVGAVAWGCQSQTGNSAKTQFVSIGTGGVTGVYYPTGGAIAKMINAKEDIYAIRASAESTAGSVFNINAVLNGDLEFGVAQSDRQYQAFNGSADWKEVGPQTKLRSVMSIHAEAVTLVAAEESGIVKIENLKGKTVNIGNPGSGQRGNATDVLMAAGLDIENDIVAESLKPSEAPKMLQDGRIDAFFYTVGHPSGAITEATSGKRKVRFVPITGMEELLKKFPYYAETTIRKATYPMALNEGDVKSIGVKATFITSADVPENTVYSITKEVFENLDEFKTLHPAFADLTREDMLKGLTAPLHAGALRYYKEVGMEQLIPDHLRPAVN